MPLTPTFTPAAKDASNVDPAEFTANLEIDPATLGGVYTGQKYVAARINAFRTGVGGSGSAPIRVFVYGDSYATGLALPDNVARRGDMALGYSNVSGGALVANTTDYAHWINGLTYTHPIGSVVNLTFGGQTTANGYQQGDECYIAYIKGPSGGASASFDLQYESSLNVGTWTTLATISTYNAGGEIGAYNTYALPASNWPYLRLRITNVTGGALIRIGAGIYNTDGGGGMTINLGDGNSHSPFQNTTPAAVFDPIWTGLAPDMVVSCFREDDHTQWDVGGAFDNFYLATKSIRAQTDWLLIGQHPSNDETYYEAMNASQKAWAIRNKESWYSPYGLFRDYATATAQGMMGDVIHLNSAGNLLRNAAIWQNQTLGRMPLGGVVGGTNGGSKMLGFTARPGTLDSQAMVIPSSLAIRPISGAYGELEMWDISSPNDFRKAMRLRMASNVCYFKTNGEDVAEIALTYAKFNRGVAYSTLTLSATGNLTSSWHTVCVNATSAPVTLTLTNTSASLDGRVQIIKKIDGSANAVTIDFAGSETCEGATTLSLPNQWSYVVIQSYAGNWIKIGGNI